MTGPGWLAGGFAALMILIAACCAARVAVSRLRRRDIELDVDGLHILMGVAMAGMLEPRLSPLPDSAWRAVFAAAAAWFAWQTIRARGRPRPGGPGCAHPAPHAVECVAMVYMLLPGSGLRPPGRGPGMTMPAMAGSAGAAARNPALALALALFMLGYVVWAADRLASPSRPAVALAAYGATQDRRPPAATASAASSPGPPGPGWTAQAGPVRRPVLAPRFAACYKIAMSIAMGYMLVMML